MKKKLLLNLFLVFWLVGCAVSQPTEREDLCKIFEEKDDWYDAAEKMREKWGVPIHVPMAMMYQESSFKYDARPPRDYILFGLVPWGRVSSAYGYAQAKTMTWKDYKRETGNSSADRDDFDDAIDFMGWFIHKTHKINRISKWDAGAQYLNYHEGWGGFKRKSYRSKQWLVKVSYKVDARAKRYAAQLKTCEDELQKNWFMRLIT